MFVPTVKSSPEKIRIQSEKILRSNVFPELLRDASNIIMILNKHRQIVYLNKNPVPHEQMVYGHSIGVRPGDCIGCINASRGELGCGSSEFCKVCGFNAAITVSEKGETGHNECHISLDNGSSLSLSVITRPFDFEDESFIFCTLEDISDTKQKQLLENVFLHDIMNTAAILNGLSNVFDQLSKEQITKMLQEVSDDLVDEVQSYRMIRHVESSTLTPRYGKVELKGLTNEVVESLQRIKSFSFKKIFVYASEGTIVTERSLLRRVLINLLKNALEAGSKEGPVEVTARLIRNNGQAEFIVKNPEVIPRTNQLRMFQKAFSTKGQGRGWGTYSIKLLTERYLKGQVDFTSEEGKGTAFTVKIPSL